MRIRALGVASLAALGWTASAQGAPPPPAPGVAAPTAVSGLSPFAGCVTPGGRGGTVFTNSAVEPRLAAHPGNPNTLIGVWQQDRWSNGAARGLLTGVSRDGGRTWTRPTPPPFSRCAGGDASNGGDYDRASDPWVSIGGDGRAYQVALGVSADLRTSAILASTSADAGRTWGSVRTVVRADDPNILHDKESVTADPRRRGYAYVVWDRITISADQQHSTGPTLFSRTTDGGATWEAPREIVTAGRDSQTLGNQIVVLPNGRLVNAFDWIVRGQTFVAVAHSDDAGATWSAPRIVDVLATTAVQDPRDGANVRASDLSPEVAVDPRAGSQVVYLLWQDARLNNARGNEIVVSVSRDGGARWSPPRRVSANPSTQAFTPAATVDSSGRLAVTYYDFTADSPTTPSLDTDLWFTQSRDNGVTLEGRRRVTPSSFDLRLAPRVVDPRDERPVEQRTQRFFLGDYSGLASAGQAFVPFFSQTTAQAGNPTDILAGRVSPTTSTGSSPTASGRQAASAPATSAPLGRVDESRAGRPILVR